MLHYSIELNISVGFTYWRQFEPQNAQPLEQQQACFPNEKQISGE
jgi:hypothetical protein